MKNLVGKTIEEISAVFVKAVNEAYEAGREAERKVTPLSLVDKATPNRQRYETIREAMDIVKRNNIVLANGRYHCKPYFEINREKRTVTCTLVGVTTNYTRKRATTRCHPNEVFNEDIGKVISLYMVSKDDIPEKFMNAVQPDEVVVGMRVIYPDEMGRGIMSVIGNERVDSYPANETNIYVAKGGDTCIIDDTNAKYGGGGE